MPRSMADDPSRHGTFDDVIAKLPYVRDLGFDVLYFPPIHPIGRTHPQGQEQQPDARARRSRQPLRHRLGGRRPRRHPSASSAASTISPGWWPRRTSTGWRSRSTSPSSARPTIPGSRSIRNGSTGGRTAASNMPRTRRRNTRTSSTCISIARRFPSHLVRAARHRALLGGQGREDFPRRQPAHQAVPVLGMDDPRGAGPRIPTSIFLAEAFTRPKVMKRLAKVGFTQSYSYFTWRNSKQELIEYLTELTRTECRALHAAELLRQHAGHQPVFPADAAAAPASASAPCWRRRSAATTASIAASSCARPSRSPARRNISTRRNTRSRPGTGTGRTTSAPDIRLHQPAAARAPGPAGLHQPHLLQCLERQYPLLRQDDRRPRTTSCSLP